jgi:hypothetical protein
MSDSLDSVKPEQIPPDKPDEKAIDERTYLEIQRIDFQLGELWETSYYRRFFAQAIFWVTVGWLIVDLIAVFFQGFTVILWCHPFVISDNVLIALIVSTTASVIGTLVIVLNYYFAKPGHRK